MSRSAHVDSVAAIASFRDAFCRFNEAASQALCALDLDIRRLGDWLEERRDYWKGEIRHQQDEVSQARIELARRKMSRINGLIPDCTEQEKAFRQAQHRLAHAEEKLDHCRRWLVKLPQEVDECQAPARRLSGMLDGDMPRLLALLDRKIAALDAYLETAPPRTDSSEQTRS